jgi:hypothetical protein
MGVTTWHSDYSLCHFYTNADPMKPPFHPMRVLKE